MSTYGSYGFTPAEQAHNEGSMVTHREDCERFISVAQRLRVVHADNEFLVLNDLVGLVAATVGEEMGKGTYVPYYVVAYAYAILRIAKLERPA